MGSAALLIPVVFPAVTHHAPTVGAALETATTLLAFAAAWLLRAQFAHSRCLRDLLLLTASWMLGVLTLLAGALPAAMGLPAGTHSTALDLWGQLFIGGMFAAAAFAPSGRLLAGRRQGITIAALLTFGAVLASKVGDLLFADDILGRNARAAGAAAPGALGHPLGLLLVFTATGLLASAAIAFPRQQLDADRVAGLFGGAPMLLAGATFYDIFPHSLASAEIAPTESLRAAAVALILIAAARQEFQSRARMARAAALAERRRVARDLHDGLAQDLAFIAAHGQRFAQEMGDDHPVVIAAKRALAISRSTISELSDPKAATVRESLEAVAHELGERFDIAIAVHAHHDPDLAPDAREHVTRIAREAIANAARHGGARNVTVSLQRADAGVALRVVDDGCGIGGGEHSAAPEGFGLRSMRERAAGLGGFCSVRRAPKGGTELEVVLP